MAYKVVVRFMDLDDNNFIYEEGWDYPRAGHFVNEARLKELSSSDNRQGIPLIEEVGEVNKKEEIIIEPIEEPIIDEIAQPIEEVIEQPIEEIEPVVEEEKVEKPKKSRKKK